MSKFCKQCGAPLAPGATACDKCGAPVNAGTPNMPASGANLANMSVFSLGILIASVVLILSTFLPYVSAFGVSQSLIKGGDGFFFIILAVVAIVGALVKKPIVTLVGGVISVLLSIFEVVSTNSQLGILSGLVDNGIGLYLNVLSSIVVAIFAVLAFLDSKKN